MNAGVNRFLERLTRPATPARGGASEELRLAENQERWALRIAFLSIALGLGAGVISVVLGVAVGLPGFIFALWLRSDAAFARMSVNQRAIIELQREALLALARETGRGPPESRPESESIASGEKE